MLFLREIAENATANATFEQIKNFYDENNLRLSDITDNTSDGAPTMMGSRTGVLTQSKFIIFYQQIHKSVNLIQCSKKDSHNEFIIVYSTDSPLLPNT